MIDQYAHSYADSTIGHIECRPMGRTNIKIKEIHNFAIPESVNQITNGTPENQGQSIG